MTFDALAALRESGTGHATADGTDLPAFAARDDLTGELVEAVTSGRERLVIVTGPVASGRLRLPHTPHTRYGTTSPTGCSTPG